MAELVFTGTSGLMGLYNSAPWVFDGAIICLFLGILFKILFEKAKIAGEGKEKQSRKFGAVVGFLMGVSLLGYMQYRNWHLLIDGGPWLFGSLILILGVFIWTLVDGYFGADSRSTSIPIVAALTLFALWFFLTNVPSYSNQLDFVLGEIGLPRGIFTTIVWGCLLFVILWGLLGVFKPGFGLGGVGSAVGGAVGGLFGGLLGGGRLGYGGVTGAGSWLGNKLKGLWPFGRRGKPTTPKNPTDIDGPNKKIDTGASDADDTVDDAKDELEKAKLVAKKLAELLKKIITFEDKKRKNIDSAKQSEINDYHSVLVALIKDLIQARKEFNALKAFQLLNAARTKCNKTADEAAGLIAYINNLDKDLKELRKRIDKTLTPPEHENLISTADADILHLEKIKTGLTSLIIAFKDTIKKVVTDTELTSLQSKLKQINDNLAAIIGTMGAQDKHLQSIEKSSEEGRKTAIEEIKKTCADIIGFATATIQALADLAGADIIGLLDHGLNSLKSAQDTFIAKKQPLIEELKKLIDEINVLIDLYNKAMQKQIAQKEGVLELQKLADAIEAERQKLLEVIGSGKQLLKDLAAWFKRPLTKEELGKLGLSEKEEAAGRAYEKFPERDPEKESTEDWRANRAEVEKRIIDRLKLLRDEESIKHKKIQEAETILTGAVAQVNYVIGELGKRTLIEGSIEKQIYDDLTEFIRKSKTLSDYLTDFDIFEKKLMETIIENYRLAFLGQEGRSSTKVQNILLAHVMKDLEALEKIVDLLKIDEDKIKEKKVPITPPRERTVPITPPASA